MTFSLPHSWVWDFWTAVDGETVHLFYLHAPKTLVDPELRHRNASIGHATSTDFVSWIDYGEVLEHGVAGDPDESATWTGSVYRDPSGTWRLYYTGSRFIASNSRTNIETVLMATSVDLFTWTKAPTVTVAANPEQYETLVDGTWHEEAWRDPWIEPDPSGNGWHMLITARARRAPAVTDPRDRGVIGHATSTDLENWVSQPQLTAPGAGFAHLEVPQLAVVDGRAVLLFSCDSAHLAGHRAGTPGGIWAVPVDEVGLFVSDPANAGPLSLENAHRITGDELYAGRIVHTPSGAALIGFENVGADGEFVGRLSDPIPMRWNESGELVAVPAS